MVSYSIGLQLALGVLTDKLLWSIMAAVLANQMGEGTQDGHIRFPYAGQAYRS
jgi:hypothetical protein